MKMELTLVCGPSGPLRERQEISADVTVGARGSVLAAELAKHYPGTGFSVAALPLESLTVGIAPLLSGAVVVAGSSTATQTLVRPVVVLAVMSGPDAGAAFPLRRGKYRIGRGSSEISIRDPSISRCQAVLDVGDRALTVSAVRGSVPFRVDGMVVQETAITEDQILSFGSTTARLTFLPLPPAQPRAAVETPIKVASPVVSPRGRWTTAAASTLPLLAGTGLALLTGQWMFLAFAATSAITAVVPLLGGRKRRRAFRAHLVSAAGLDAIRRTASAPSLADIALCGPSPPAGVSPLNDDDGLHLRVGTADQPANLLMDPPNTTFEPPVLRGLPAVVSLKTGEELAIDGPIPDVEAMVRALLMQLAAEGIRTCITGDPEKLPLPARFLPRVILTANAETLRAELAAGAPPTVVIDVGGDNAITKTLETALPMHRVHLIRCRDHGVAGAGDPKAQLLRLAAGPDGYSGHYGGLDFLPDLPSTQTFDRFARKMAAAGPKVEEEIGGIRPSCFLAAQTRLTATAIGRNWTRETGGLTPIPLGQSSNGPVLLDLERDGPHLLVAGTTGSGKSELLRTLVVSLALHHPPSLLSFLFVDFKGGSGLGSLSGLPHATGLITDINGSGMERVLTSLRAEIRYREGLFSRSGVPDLRHYDSDESRGLARIAHLVLVIDEFRILVDQVPEAMDQLMQIAALGRSLGIHLVLATQRPQGAISADIRANITTSICLRVQSAFESQDVIGVPAAASLPVALPGRAYLRSGSEPPLEFQTAVLRKPPMEDANNVRIRSARSAFSDPPRRPRSAASEADLAHDVVRLIAEAHAASGTPLPRAPVAPELPPVLEPDAIEAAMALPSGGLQQRRTDAITLGLMDLPQNQAVGPLVWEPRVQSHLALIGAKGSGARSAARLAACSLLRAPGLNASLYCLDGDGSLAGLAGVPGVGAYLAPADARAAVRLLGRLAGMHRQRADQNLLGLAVTSWGTWLSTFRSGPWPWAEDLLANIVRDGPGKGVVLIASGERELLASPAMAGIPNRLYFPKGASSESMMAWPKLPPVVGVPGRAVATGPLAEDAAKALGVAAGASVEADGPAVSSGNNVTQLLHATGAALSAMIAASPRRPLPPFMVRALPDSVSATDVLLSALAGENAAGQQETQGAIPNRLLLGLGGDGWDAVNVQVNRGSVLLATGTPQSGKTSLLDALPVLNPNTFAWLRPDGVGPAGTYWISRAQELLEASNRQASMAERSAVCALVDDLQELSPAAQTALERLRASGAVVIATGTAAADALARIPLALVGRSSGTGLVLGPAHSQDGDFFGRRLDTEGPTPPGRAVLLVNGSLEWLQLADPRR